MEKLSHATENILDENVEKLSRLFPEVVTEVREPDGTLRHTIDVEALKARVGDVAEGQRERYQFTWPGKRDAKQEAYRPIDKCLRPCPEESVNWDTTENLYIEGDNLDALKLLRNTYAGKIKMIYIDPPYNTGHDFIYDDDFARTKADYDAESGDYDEDGGRLVANLESNGRFHSDWCSMMYPRLLLARDLLSEGGVIFLSIGDDEVEQMAAIVKAVFGMANFITILPRISKRGSNKGTYFRPTKDYILVACREKGKLAPFSKPAENAHVYPFVEKDSSSRCGQRYRKGHSLYQSSLDSRPNQRYYIQAPDGSLIIPPGNVYPSELLDGSYVRPESNVDKVWRWSWQSYLSHRDAGEIMFEQSARSPLRDSLGNPSKWNVYEKKYEEDEIGKECLPDDFIEGFLNSSATEELSNMDIPFSFSKPVGLIRYLLSIAHIQSESIVLDFFSGSATTAHAVMKLNAEDGGNRKFIMVQLPEVCDEKSEAAKAGYKNICEIGKERIRRAGMKIAEEVEESNRQLKLDEEPKRVPDIGFRVLKIDSSNFEDVAAEPAAYSQQMLAGLADNLKPGRTSDDILFQVMPQFQIPLSAKIETKSINGSMVFSVDGGRLVACFDRNVSTETIVEMAKMEPDYAVMRDASFAGDDAVSNFGELFKTYSPATITRVV